MAGERATGGRVDPLEPDVVAALDPGIRATVVTLRAAGFETTDSGDGLSKLSVWVASDEAIPFPHVACVTAREGCFLEADRLADLLGDEWQVEASYAPGGPVILFARVVLPSITVTAVLEGRR
jgi:hypothetical protein